ncbi:hypothetical protein [Methanosphaerula palustris]|uniref:TiaS-like TCKD domain-containing protein n=1 Tax=Methanosphaerula palustris (strain ATCC BAA-1556 / DSM 19958 / E1-9c) TaxID=521011 RepID=B8GDE6_METPE|nr:hypothetical protein [Methanosphaerula palustris]ACL17297.1 conserved hypothetical protein [Methanosphaerula palustris E1-9c]
MSRVLERRRQFLSLMRQFTLDRGFFQITDVAEALQVPRSTAQDWVKRLIEEGCLIVRESPHGRHGGHYAAVSAVPASTCRRIFTTTDGDEVEIFHECISGACAAFCGFHHTKSGGVITAIERDGPLLREHGRIGEAHLKIGLYPAPAVGVGAIRREGVNILQEITSIGGPAYSLTEMIGHAEGVCEVRIRREGSLVTGEVITQDLTHLIIGIDDTDGPDGGATFALAVALLQHLGRIKGVIPIGHRVAMLNPSIEQKTVGNACSYLELAVDPELVTEVTARCKKFVGDESRSPEWGIAVKEGFQIGPALRAYGECARIGYLSRDIAEETAAAHAISLYGGDGVIGALAAVALAGVPTETLLDLRIPIC